MKRQFRAAAGLALLAVLSFAAGASAQDPVRVAPRMYKVRLNTPRVRVLEVTGKPGQKSRMHAHPDYVVYNLEDGKVRFTDAKGAKTDADLKAGEAMWRGAEHHASEAVTNIHAMLFELKGPKRAARAARGDDPVKVDPDHYKVLLDNERVRVIEYRAAPGDKTPMHAHPDYVTYSMSDTKTRFTYPKRRAVELASSNGQVVWHAAETHAGQVTGKNEAHVLIVELK
jgi:quercetin dioxygenase-like cupin family protein